MHDPKHTNPHPLFGPHTPLRTPDDVKEAVSGIHKSFQKKRPIDISLVMALADSALSTDNALAASATRALFSSVIEMFCDDFSEHGALETARTLVVCIDRIRKHPDGQTLETLLRQHGFTPTTKLLDRFEKMCQPRTLPKEAAQEITSIILLSRVTAGADIAVTAPILMRLLQHFPQATFYLIGPNHLQEMFGHIERLRFCTFIYKNDGSLLEKLATWPSLRALIAREIFSHADSEKSLLFDPDSRLSQLGLLPLMSDTKTFFFPSRSKGEQDPHQQNLSQLAHSWMNQVLGTERPRTPFFLPPTQEAHYADLRNQLKKNGCQRLITVNFGVGSDPKKQIDEQFEARLLTALFMTPHTVILLDSGRGTEEKRRALRHIERLQAKGLSSFDFGPQKNEAPLFNHGIILHDGSLGSLGKIISLSDCFIGYDSCGQHIANASGTPSVIIFAGAPSKRFVARWSPADAGRTTIPLYRQTSLNERELDSLLKNVVEAVSRTYSTNSSC